MVANIPLSIDFRYMHVVWQKAFGLTANLLVVADASVAGSTKLVLQFSVKSTKYTGLVQSYSNVGTVHLLPLINTIIAFALAAAKGEVNKLLAHGFPVPSVAGVSLKNAAVTSVSSGCGFLRVTTDIVWNPTVEQH